MIHNLGTVLTILARQEASEIFRHADVDAFGGPSDLASLGECQRERTARKLAESTAQRPLRVIAAEAARRGCPIGSPRWQSFVGRVYESRYPF